MLNSLPTKLFNRLLQRIATSENEEKFSEEELCKLGESLKISDENVKLLIQSLTYIYKQSNKIILKPTVLQKHFVEHLELDPEKSEEFVKIWSTNIKDEVGDFENRLKVEDISWELNWQIADQIENKQNISIARLKFDFSPCHDVNKSNDSLIVEMNEEELTQFYQTIENIQIKLDNINSG